MLYNPGRCRSRHRRFSRCGSFSSFIKRGGVKLYSSTAQYQDELFFALRAPTPYYWYLAGKLKKVVYKKTLAILKYDSLDEAVFYSICRIAPK